MSMSLEEIMMDEAYAELHEEAVMKAAALAQCIYLFVEGDSEEQAFPILLEEGCGLDLKELGVVIANYNGIGNLKHGLRLLGKTLSHDRPIVVTYDNDEEGKKAPSVIDRFYSNRKLLYPVTIPNKPVVRYTSGHIGGSFEEAFEPQDFINACFQKSIIDTHLLSEKFSFQKRFKPDVPWYSQIARFCKENGDKKFTSRKVDLAIELAESCETIPSTFQDLAAALSEVRAKFPVKHPDDVELPRVYGLTC
jgi:predicted ATP-dependent endonuclease of OLD family